jgi:hypothetical protein
VKLESSGSQLNVFICLTGIHEPWWRHIPLLPSVILRGKPTSVTVTRKAGPHQAPWVTARQDAWTGPPLQTFYKM